MNSPIAGMQCIRVNETNQPGGHTWHDNYLCMPRHSPYTDLDLIWSNTGPISGKSCIEWTESVDSAWDNNYLCATMYYQI